MALMDLIFLCSTALFAGSSVSVSVVAVPAILSSSDPLPAWIVLYNRGKNFAFATFAATISSGLIVFTQRGDFRLIVAAILTSLIILYTRKFMSPTNNALFKLHETGPKTEQTKNTARNLIGTWASRQWGRTAISVLVFILGVEGIIT